MIVKSHSLLCCLANNLKAIVSEKSSLRIIPAEMEGSLGILSLECWARLYANPSPSTGLAPFR